jgi:hypothetical protein
MRAALLQWCHASAACVVKAERHSTRGLVVVSYASVVTDLAQPRDDKQGLAIQAPSSPQDKKAPDKPKLCALPGRLCMCANAMHTQSWGTTSTRHGFNKAIEFSITMWQ